MSDAARLLTAEEFAGYPNARHSDLVRGVPRVCEPPGGRQGRLAGTIAARLYQHVERLGLGTVLTEAGYLLGRAPDTVRGPDVSFIGTARLPPDQIPEGFIAGAPDLAVEILSASNRWPDVEEKLADYLGAGTRMVWVLDPRERRAVVRYPDRPPLLLAANGVLDGEDVVPGFALELEEMFGRHA
ncbi:MAG: Uma2 family endonuclease [Gemmatimonadales bacterium]